MGTHEETIEGVGVVDTIIMEDYWSLAYFLYIKNNNKVRIGRNTLHNLYNKMLNLI